MIAKANKKVAIRERVTKKLEKLFKSEIGQEVADALHYNTLNEIKEKFKISYIEHMGRDTAQQRVLDVMAKKAGLQPRYARIVDYTGLSLVNKENAAQAARKAFIEQYNKNKPCLRLTPYEQKLLNKRDEWEILRDANGNPVVKTIPDNSPTNISKKRILYDAITGIPIYVMKRKPKRKDFPLAMKCHMYELHKMAKWDRNNPPPEESELKANLFPNELMAAYKTRRSIANENIRNMLSNRYCGTKTKMPYLRLFASHTSTGYNGEQISWERECDPYIYGYPFTSCISMPSVSYINEKLKRAMMHADQTVTSLKVYDMFGNQRGMLVA